MIAFPFIQLPSLDKFFSNGIVAGLMSLFEYIVDLFATVAQALQHFYATISELNDYVKMWTNSMSGSGAQIPVVASIGAYRYLVGEGAFYLTYVVILCGCLFTIFQLVYIIQRLFDKLQAKINSKEKKTASNIIELAKYFFKEG